MSFSLNCVSFVDKDFPGDLGNHLLKKNLIVAFCEKDIIHVTSQIAHCQLHLMGGEGCFHWAAQYEYYT